MLHIWFVLRVMVALLVIADAAVPQPPSFADRAPRYLLGPSDVLEIHYRYSQEFDQTVTVQPDGFVSLVLIGDLKVAGSTVEEAKTAILAKSSQRLKDPEITVVLKEFEKPYFVVAGEVASPGKFEMRGQVNTIQAIAMAGGLKSFSAKHSQVILFRRVGPDIAKTQLLDLKAAMSPHTATEAVLYLRPGDMLVVPQNRITKIERIVKMSNIGAYIPF